MIHCFSIWNTILPYVLSIFKSQVENFLSHLVFCSCEFIQDSLCSRHCDKLLAIQTIGLCSKNLTIFGRKETIKLATGYKKLYQTGPCPGHKEIAGKSYQHGKQRHQPLSNHVSPLLQFKLSNLKIKSKASPQYSRIGSNLIELIKFKWDHEETLSFSVTSVYTNISR